MPTLQFKGKNIIWNHHLSVPYHTLDEVGELCFQQEKGNGNLIIEGDNLLALKALLPQYAGKIKCIYIDPPYNTGNEGWIYNDNVNSPLLQKWFKDNLPVARNDLTRHDKWLCMMTPRLKLLYELLDEKGVMFVSIGEHELGNLVNLMNDIFGQDKLVTVLAWKSRAKPTNAGNAKFRPQKVAEYILAYSKVDPEELLFNLASGEDRVYPHEDTEGKYRYTTILTSNLGVYKRETMRFNLNGFTPSSEQRWKAGEDEIQSLYEKGRIIFNEDGSPIWKKYKQDEDELLSPMYTFIDPDLSGTAEHGKAEVNKLIGRDHGFDTIKPVNLIKYLIQISTSDSDIILDSFAGTGTTMQAVLELNNEDNGSRKCILVQMPESSSKEPNKNICRDITSKRVENAINKYNYDCGYKYLRVGLSIDPENLLEGVLPSFEQFAEYVYYIATGNILDDKSKINSKSGFVNSFGKQAIYLIYEQDLNKLTRLALNLQKAEEINEESKGMRKIIYAPACFLDEEYMQSRQIEFVSIPYNLFQRKVD